MSSQLALERGPVGTAPSEGTPLGLIAGAAAVRGLAVAVSGAVLAAAISLLLWALTPASGSDAMVAIKAGVAGFAAANLMPVTIGGVSLTIPPLLFTALIVALLMGTSRRGRFLPVGRGEESAAVVVTAASYGLAVAIITRGFAPEGVVPAGWVWTAGVIALMATAVAMTWAAGSAWHEWWCSSVTGWVRSAARAAGIGLGVMIAGGGAALTAAMILHFGAMVSVGALAAPSWTDGLGLALLGAAYVPNAVLGAVGYVSGVGFEIGPATFSPFASTTVDLPALPLLAATPDHIGRSLLGMVFLAVPLIAGYLMAHRVGEHLGSRSERVLAVVLAAAGTGILLGVLSWLARGGVGNARWAVMGAPPLLVGVVVAGELAAVGVAVAVLTGIRTVPWRPAGVGPIADAGAAPEVGAPEVGGDDVGADDVEPDEVAPDEVEIDELDSDAVDATPAADAEITDGDDTDTDTGAGADTDTEVAAEDARMSAAEDEHSAESQPADAADLHEQTTARKSAPVGAEPVAPGDAEDPDGIYTATTGPGVTLPEQRVHSDDRVAPGRADFRE